jgi:hypothetical protein
VNNDNAAASYSENSDLISIGHNSVALGVGIIVDRLLETSISF